MKNRNVEVYCKVFYAKLTLLMSLGFLLEFMTSLPFKVPRKLTTK